MRLFFSNILLILTAFNHFSFKASEHVLVSEPVVVAELFTSQGCSSCPSADKLLGEIVAEAEAQNKPVFGISFHVTYWNHHGWKDPYSQEAFTLRQKKYAEVMKLQTIYTPQVVVNGIHEFVGSDRKTFDLAMKLVRAEPSLCTINAEAEISQGQLMVKYHVNESSENKWLNAALVETQVKNYVKRGENQGRILKHYNVARMFTTAPLAATDTITIELPEDIELEKSAVILYAQDAKSFRILGATQIKLNNKP